MNFDNIKNVWGPAATSSIRTASDDAVLEEVDRRGLNPGVTYTDLLMLANATAAEDWSQVRSIVKRLMREHLGRIG